MNQNSKPFPTTNYYYLPTVAKTRYCCNVKSLSFPGNPNDKVLYGRPNKRRSASFPAPRSLDRRHSLRIFGSSSKYLQRCASTRSLHHKHANTTDSSSSTDYPPSVESASPSTFFFYYNLLTDMLLGL